MKQVSVVIDTVGNPTIEAKGFTDAGCTRATKPIEEAFAGGATNVVARPEMHVPERTKSGTKVNTGGSGGYGM